MKVIVLLVVHLILLVLHSQLVHHTVAVLEAMLENLQETPMVKMLGIVVEPAQEQILHMEVV